MKIKIFVTCCLGLLSVSCGGQKPAPEAIFQVSTFDALMEGQFDGTTTFGRLKNLGDFGLGTFDKLDGEMICLDGQFYQVKTDGKAYKVKPSMKAPFADVTSFEADQIKSLKELLNYQQVQAYLDEQLPDKDGYYAIKIEGVFRYLRTRSVPAQEPPYPTLTKAIANQVAFEYEQIQGTMVGFRTPEAVQGTSTTGYHFHFISADKSKGGHVLDCVIDDVQIAIDQSDGLKVLPLKK